MANVVGDIQVTNKMHMTANASIIHYLQEKKFIWYVLKLGIYSISLQKLFKLKQIKIRNMLNEFYYTAHNKKIKSSMGLKSISFHPSVCFY